MYYHTLQLSFLFIINSVFSFRLKCILNFLLKAVFNSSVTLMQ